MHYGVASKYLQAYIIMQLMRAEHKLRIVLDRRPKYT